jgi:hypothetical protein
LKYISVSLGLLVAGTGIANATCPAGSTIINSLPATLSSAGTTYCLASSRIITTPNAVALSITASNITLDLDRWTISGPGYYNDTVSGVGISVTNNAQNVTIQNGALVGFNGGIIMSTNTGSNSTDGLLIDNMSIRGMGTYGIAVLQNSSCDNCVVQNSQVYNVDANRNTSQGGYSGAYGIYFAYSDNLTITNNNIIGLYSRGSLPSYGIYLYRGQYAEVEGNTVSDNAYSTTNDTGILFFSFRDGTAVNNNLSYIYTGIRFAYSAGGLHSGNTFYHVTRPIIGGTAF